jgi:hypothetical protein
MAKQVIFDNILIYLIKRHEKTIRPWSLVSPHAKNNLVNFLHREGCSEKRIRYKRNFFRLIPNISIQLPPSDPTFSKYFFVKIKNVFLNAFRIPNLKPINNNPKDNMFLKIM